MKGDLVSVEHSSITKVETDSSTTALFFCAGGPHACAHDAGEIASAGFIDFQFHNDTTIRDVQPPVLRTYTYSHNGADPLLSQVRLGRRPRDPAHGALNR